MVTPNVFVSTLRSQNHRSRPIIHSGSDIVNKLKTVSLQYIHLQQFHSLAGISLGLPYHLLDQKVVKQAIQFRVQKTFTFKTRLAAKPCESNFCLHENKDSFSYSGLKNSLNCRLSFGQVTLTFYFSGPLLAGVSYCFCWWMTCLGQVSGKSHSVPMITKKIYLSLACEQALHLEETRKLARAFSRGSRRRSSLLTG